MQGAMFDLLSGCARVTIWCGWGSAEAVCRRLEPVPEGCVMVDLLSGWWAPGELRVLYTKFTTLSGCWHARWALPCADLYSNAE